MTPLMLKVAIRSKSKAWEVLPSDLSFIDEVMKMIPVVRSLCPENMLAHEFEQCTVKFVLVPLRELLSSFSTPHKLIVKWRDKFADSVRLHSTNPELANQAKQVFSALNAQLMAELPKLCSLSESLLLASMVSLTNLVEKLLEKISMQRPKAKSDLQTALQNYENGNRSIWKSIHHFQSFSNEHSPLISNNQRKNTQPMLNKVTQNESERAYVLQTYDSELYEVKQKWISGDANDCWATPGDIVRRLELVPSGVDKNKVLVDTGRKKGFLPYSILSEFHHKPSLRYSEVGIDKTDRRNSSHSAESDSFSDGGSKQNHDLINFNESAVAQYDFQGRSEGELTIFENEILTILARADMDGNSEWFKVENKIGKQGYVPSSYLSTAS
jgi:hypothetical protein